MCANGTVPPVSVFSSWLQVIIVNTLRDFNNLFIDYKFILVDFGIINATYYQNFFYQKYLKNYNRLNYQGNNIVKVYF